MTISAPNPAPLVADIAIIGAGIAGASLAAEIGDAANIVLVEAEAQPGYHSTGRSAAFWSETYGGPAIQPLTSASGPWLRDHGFLGARGALHIADATSEADLDRLAREFAVSGVRLDPVDRAQLEQLLPSLAPKWIRGLSEPSCQDIDVAALHSFYLASARRSGVRLVCDARVEDIRRENGRWTVHTRAGPVEAGIVVNAAGAWAGPVAAMAGAATIAMVPHRRTVVQLAVDPPAPADLPLILDAGGNFYFKSESGGRLWLSPHDETEVAPQDVVPEEIDVAIAIDRFEQAVDWRVVRRERAWAGLRTFSPDRAPVYGYDPRVSDFFWFAGQGGFGIQTAPAAAMLAAAILLERPFPTPVADIDAARYHPARFGS
jgi:D-arginine dehydrogenase